MASAGPSHPSFPARPYSSTLHGKIPDRSGPSFAASSRENARLERERQERERAQREAAQQVAGSSNPLANITDEQREEINEAVRSPLNQPRPSPPPKMQ
jgi:centrin-3